MNGSAVSLLQMHLFCPAVLFSGPDSVLALVIFCLMTWIYIKNAVLHCARGVQSSNMDSMGFLCFTHTSEAIHSFAISSDFQVY